MGNRGRGACLDGLEGNANIVTATPLPIEHQFTTTPDGFVRLVGRLTAFASNTIMALIENGASLGSRQLDVGNSGRNDKESLMGSRQTSATTRSVLSWPTGLTVHDRGRASPGYTLLTPFGSPIVYLLDAGGEVLHMWFVSTGPAQRMTVHAKYVGGGHILFAPGHGGEGWTREESPAGDWLYEMDWHGNVVWSYAPDGPPEDPHGLRSILGWDPRYKPWGPHHDFQRLPNGNTILLCGEALTDADISDHELRSDYFLEVAPDGTPVWVWHSDQHYGEFGFGEEARRLIRQAPGLHMGLGLGDYLHTNTLEVLPDTPLGRRDPRFRATNILSSQRNTNTIFVVDRESSRVVWTWGREELVGPHHQTMLDDSHILVYDNGGLAGYPRRARPYTRLVELDPESGKIVWTYRDHHRSFYHQRFFSMSWGTAQRLPNGNTFSLDANLGRLFEVTPDGEIVWEYVNGFLGSVVRGGGQKIDNGIYRAYRLPYDSVPDFSRDFDFRSDEPPKESTLLSQPRFDY